MPRNKIEQDKRFCEFCGKSYEEYPSRERKFCSNSCASKAKWQNVEYRKFQESRHVIPLTEEQKIRISKSCKRKWLDPDFRRKWMQARRNADCSHSKSIMDFLHVLTRKGYTVYPQGAKGFFIPDIIAVKDGKIVCIEVAKNRRIARTILQKMDSYKTFFADIQIVNYKGEKYALFD